MAIKSILAALFAPLTAVAVAAPAHADQYDYVSQLDNNGIYYSSISQVIDMGKQLCSIGRSAPINGSTMGSLFWGVMRSGGYTSSTEAGIILSAAAHNMCPDILARISADDAMRKSAPVPQTIG